VRERREMGLRFELEILARNPSCDNDAVEVSCVMAKRRFSDDILATLRPSKGLRIRAGNGTHRFIGIWVVVVNNRVFVRSWSLKLGGWYRTFLGERRRRVQIANREFLVRAVRTRSERVKDAVDRAYLEKYTTPGESQYARDLVRAHSRDATIELVPMSLSNAPISVRC
jgi:hypothetical protein